jgi:anti-anti-sigma factor
MSLLARVVDEQVGPIVVAVVDGEIDASNARELGERLRASLMNDSLALVVDLGGTTYIDSAGINQLFELGLELRQRRQGLRLVVPEPSPIARALAISGLDHSVATHSSRAAALERAAASNA